MAKKLSVRTNVAKPPTKPKAVVVGHKSPEYKVERGSTSYKPADVRTGHGAYGKESASKPTPEFVKKAQSARVDTVVGKGGDEGKAGLTYAAGTRTTSPDKFSMTTTVPKLQFVKEEPKLEATGKQSTVRKIKPRKTNLKPMAMTYGTDSPKSGGGTKYVRRVRK